MSNTKYLKQKKSEVVMIDAYGETEGHHPTMAIDILIETSVVYYQ